MFDLVSQAFKNAVADSGAYYHIQFLESGNVLDVSIHRLVYSGSLTNNGKIEIGNTISNSIEFEIYENNIVLQGKELLVQVGIETSEDYIEYINLGYFTVQKPTFDGVLYRYKAFDRMYKLSEAYNTTLEFPVTDEDVLDDICSQTGIFAIKPTSIGHNFSMLSNAYTMREMIGSIAAINGCNAVFNRDGVLEFVWYHTNSDLTIDGHRIYEGGLTFSAETPYTILSVTLAKYTNTETEVFTDGEGTGLVYQGPVMTKDIETEIYNKVKDFSYQPMTVRFLGNPLLDLGDRINVVVQSSEDVTDIYQCSVMNITQDYQGGLITEVTCVAEEPSLVGIDTTSLFQKDQRRFEISLKETVGTVKELGTEVSVMQGQIDGKIWEQDISEALEDFSSRNLIRNSKTLLFTDYNFIGGSE